MAPHLSVAYQQQQFVISRSQGFKKKTPLLHTFQLRTEYSVHTVGLQGKPQSGRPLRPAAAMKVCWYSHRKKILCHRYLVVPLNAMQYLCMVNHDQLLKKTQVYQCSLSPGKDQQHKEMYRF